MNARTKPVSIPESWGELGPAMRALPNEKWRLFVRYYVLTPKPGHGAATRAYCAAGFNSSPKNRHIDTYHLLLDDRVIAAIAEESKKYFRTAIPAAVQAAHNMIADPTHKDHGRVVMATIDRADPLVTHHNMLVTHKHVDPDQEALEELRALRQLGTGRDKLLELFGPNGLDRIEALEAADHAKRAAQAKVIDAQVVEEDTAERRRPPRRAASHEAVKRTHPAKVIDAEPEELPDPFDPAGGPDPDMMDDF
jgi:hypothetical protein